MSEIQNSSCSTGEILKDIKKAIRENNTLVLGEKLSCLIKIKPDRWFTLLALEHVISDPYKSDFLDIIDKFIKSIEETEYLYNADEVELLVSRFLGLKNLNVVFSSLKNQLDSLTIWREQIVSVIHAVAAFVEDHEFTSKAIIQKIVEEKGHFDPFSQLISENYEAGLDHGRTNPIQAYETYCEALQLILAYSIQKFRSEYYGFSKNVKCIYDEPDLIMLLRLACLWRVYDNLWEKIKYAGWIIRFYEGKKDINFVIPSIRDDFLRYDIGGIRSERIKGDFGVLAGIVNQNTIRELSRLIEHLAKSITIPEKVHIWNGQCDLPILKKSVRIVTDKVFNQEFLLDQSLFFQLAPDVKIGNHENEITWDEYIRSMDVLRILADSFHKAVELQVNRSNKSEIQREAIYIRKDTLSSIISMCQNLDLDVCKKTVDLVIFNPKLRNIELWDTPLIPVNNDLILFVPTIVKNGNPARTIENFIAEWNKDLFTKRGRILEYELVEFLKCQKLRAIGPIKVRTENREEVEFDLVLSWEGLLMLIEAKCTKSVFTGLDYYRAKEHIEYAISQLNERREFLFKNWDNFRQAASELNLPYSPPPASKVKLIAVTNILGFTGWKSRDVIVADKQCIERFFDVAEIQQFQNGKLVKNVGRIRKSDKPKAKEFIKYLERPPQVKAIEKYLSKNFIGIPYLHESDPKFFYAHTTFTVSENSLQKDNQRTTKVGRRRKSR